MATTIRSLVCVLMAVILAKVAPDLDPEILSPSESDQTMVCDEANGGCDEEDVEEFDGDDAAGLSAEPSLLEWAFDQYYASKTLVLAVANKLETPNHRLVRTEQSYEVREYPAHRWVCTHELTAGFFSSTDGKDVFRRLFRYFSGKNGAGARMTITSPLLLHRDPRYEGVGQRFTACLPLPNAHQQEPPHPLSSRVHLQTFPRSRVLALASYDLPQKFWHRRNEVWLRQAAPAREDGPPEVMNGRQQFFGYNF
ncbi:Heme-binding protein 2 [Amphibalanus amphitrite]|uniref:Heme-binding protein 2 n=1 Tax=Amphibalanus amphitrite TaxID=1232801 RepID=A0A6A4V960_AMPAM|nr:Heme-binding protein 2 [Amphibalanus amphitrite]